MKYRDITADVGDRFRMPASHPILAKIVIDPVDWFQFERLDDDNPATRILGHEMSGTGLTIFIACASDEVSSLLNDGWG